MVQEGDRRSREARDVLAAGEIWNRLAQFPVDLLVHLSGLAQGGSELPGHLGHALRAEEGYHHDEDDDQLCEAEVQHAD